MKDLIKTYQIHSFTLIIKTNTVFKRRKWRDTPKDNNPNPTNNHPPPNPPNAKKSKNPLLPPPAPAWAQDNPTASTTKPQSPFLIHKVWINKPLYFHNKPMLMGTRGISLRIKKMLFRYPRKIIMMLRLILELILQMTTISMLIKRLCLLILSPMLLN